jgi:hypothetical protein
LEFIDLKKEIDTLANYFMRDAKDCSYSREISGLKGSVRICGSYYVCRACDADLVIAHVMRNEYARVEKINIGDHAFLNIYSTYPEEDDEPILIGKLPLRLRLTLDEFISSHDDYHVLTYAEEGFAPLSQHTRSADITKDQLVKFAAEVNSRGEIGTLSPLAAISAIPRAYLREPDLMSAQFLADQIIKFLRLNEETIGATKIALDFRTPDVADFVFTAIDRTLNDDAASVLNRVAIIIKG